MERSKIPMLSRFDAISHIMPYYDQTHKAFLLLSNLCSETRSKLDEFYNEFVTHMKENWIFVEANSTDRMTSIFLPNDLFEVSIDCRDPKAFDAFDAFDSFDAFDAFIEFIENLKDSKGWYFNRNYMHSKIKIRDPITVDIRNIKTLYAYVDVLKSTQVILCKKNPFISKLQYESSTLDTNWNHALIILKRIDINVPYAYIFMNLSRILNLRIYFIF